MARGRLRRVRGRLTRSFPFLVALVAAVMLVPVSAYASSLTDALLDASLQGGDSNNVYAVDEGASEPDVFHFKGEDSGLYFGHVLNGRDAEAGQFAYRIKPEDEKAARKFNMSMDGIEVPFGAAKSGETSWVAQTGLDATFTPDDDGEVYHFYAQVSRGYGTGYGVDSRTWEFGIGCYYDEEDGTYEIRTVVNDQDQGSQFTGEITSDGEREEEGYVSPAWSTSYTPTGELGGESDTVIKASASMRGRALVDGELSFEVTDEKGKVVSAGTNDASGAITFDSLTYTAESMTADAASGVATESGGVYTYRYTVSEVTDGLEDVGVTIDSASFDITVTVRGDGKDGYTCAVDYGDAGDGLRFKNAYRPTSASLEISGSQRISGAPELDVPSLGDVAGDFSYTLTGLPASDGTPAPMPAGANGATAHATNDGHGVVSFGSIVYTLENVWAEGEDDGAAQMGEDDSGAVPMRSKTFTYRVAQVGVADGVSADTSVQTIEVTVADDGKGALEVTSSAESGSMFTFSGVYHEAPHEDGAGEEGGTTGSASGEHSDEQGGTCGEGGTESATELPATGDASYMLVIGITLTACVLIAAGYIVHRRAR